MKTIITTVGTSIFENFMKEEVRKVYEIETGYTLPDISEHFKELKDNRKWGKNYSPIESAEKKITKIIKSKWLKGFSKQDNEWIKTDDQNKFASAEIESIEQLKNEIGNSFKIKLIMTDISLSRLAGELIHFFLKENGIESDIQPYIKSLSVNDSEKFRKEGIINLFQELDNIMEYGREASDFYMLNITGGYKGLIPFISTFSQLNDIKTFYLFENSKKLIWIPLLPISIDYGIFQENFPLFQKLKDGVIENWENFKRVNKIIPHIENQLDIIKDQGKDLIGLNAVGEYLFHRFNNSILIKINKSISIFSENEGNKNEIRSTLRELFERLGNEITFNQLQKEEEINKYINRLGDKSDLRHGQNPGSGIYIFKSTKIGQIRIVYGIEFVMKKLSIILYDYKRGQFNHSAYLDEFRKKYNFSKNLEFVPIAIPK